MYEQALRCAGKLEAGMQRQDVWNQGDLGSNQVNSQLILFISQETQPKVIGYADKRPASKSFNLFSFLYFSNSNIPLLKTGILAETPT